MNNKNPKVDGFLSRTTQWREEFEALRMILLDLPLTEDLKWGVPCYSSDNRNIALIHGFKEYCAILFVKGSLLKDPQGILIQQTDKVQAARQARFTKAQEIVDLAPVLKDYVLEAIEVEKSGLKVDYKGTSEFTIPEEFQSKLDQVPALKTAFHALTPGRQRAYLLYFTAPKQSRTRASRVEKYTQQILAGRGLND